MKVFRIENKTCGSGPYHSDNRPASRYTTYKHLGPYHDGLYDYMDKDILFGFISEDTMAGWFIDSLMTLHNEGFICRIYVINKIYVRVSRTYSQCIFDKKFAVSSEKVLSLKEIFEKYKREIYST